MSKYTRSALSARLLQVLMLLHAVREAPWGAQGAERGRGARTLIWAPLRSHRVGADSARSQPWLTAQQGAELPAAPVLPRAPSPAAPSSLSQALLDPKELWEFL